MPLSALRLIRSRRREPGASGAFVRRLALASAVIAVLSAIPWLAFTAANMAGEMRAAVDWDALGPVLRDTALGHIALSRRSLDPKPASPITNELLGAGDSERNERAA
jgi:hypothetical protein